MKTCLYLVEIFLSLHTVLLLRFSLAMCDGGSFIFRNCLICCWMDIPPLINPFSCGWTSGLFLEFYDYGQCRRPWRLLGWGSGQGLPTTRSLIRAGKNPGLFITFSGADVTQSPHLTPVGGFIKMTVFVFHCVKIHTTQNYHLKHF